MVKVGDMVTSVEEDFQLITNAIYSVPATTLDTMEWRISKERLLRMARALGVASIAGSDIAEVFTLYGRPIKISPIDEIILVLVVRPAHTESFSDN